MMRRRAHRALHEPQLALQLITFLCWGHWSVVRRVSRWSTERFMVLAIYVQCVVALGLMGVVDGAGVAAAPDALGTFAGRLALLAGACMAVGDGCITVMTDRLGVGVAAPVIFTTNIVFGATLDFLVAEGEPGECRVAYFGLGLACAVAGIVANVLSTPRPEDGLAARRRGWRFAAPLADCEAADAADAITATAAAFAAKATAATPLLPPPPPPPKAPPSPEQELRSAAASLGFCVAVGLFSGGWSPLLAYAETVRGGAPAGALHACTQVGVFLAVTAVAAGRAAAGAKSRRPPDDFDDDGARCAALRDHAAVPALTGALLAVGYTTYFAETAASASTAASYALGSCSSCVPMFYSYFVIREYVDAPPRKHRLFAAAALLYALAVLFLALSDSGMCEPDRAPIRAVDRPPGFAARFPDRRRPQADRWAP